ncbi:hypothetical protein AHAS_Ahas19G0260800 [Arachis hypogaea]
MPVETHAYAPITLFYHGLLHLIRTLFLPTSEITTPYGFPHNPIIAFLITLKLSSLSNIILPTKLKQSDLCSSSILWLIAITFPFIGSKPKVGFAERDDIRVRDPLEPYVLRSSPNERTRSPAE